VAALSWWDIADDAADEVVEVTVLGGKNSQRAPAAEAFNGRQQQQQLFAPILPVALVPWREAPLRREEVAEKFRGTASVGLRTPRTEDVTSVESSPGPSMIKKDCHVKSREISVASQISSRDESKYDLVHPEPDAEPERVESQLDAQDEVESPSSNEEEEERVEHESLRAIMEGLSMRMAASRENELDFHREHRKRLEELESKCVLYRPPKHPTKELEEPVPMQIAPPPPHPTKEHEELVPMQSAPTSMINDCEIQPENVFRGGDITEENVQSSTMDPVNLHDLANPFEKDFDSAELAANDTLWAQDSARPLSPVAEDPAAEESLGASVYYNGSVESKPIALQHPVEPIAPKHPVEPIASVTSLSPQLEGLPPRRDSGTSLWHPINAVAVPSPPQRIYSPPPRRVLPRGSASPPIYPAKEIFKLQKMTDEIRNRDIVDQKEIEHLDQLVSRLSTLVGGVSPIPSPRRVTVGARESGVEGSLQAGRVASPRLTYVSDITIRQRMSG
jgi:hypothetical protein